MKEGKYIKTFTKIQVRGVFHMRDFQRNVFIPQVIELCTETPCWCPYEEQSTLHKLFTVSVTRWSCATVWLPIFFAYVFIIIINLYFNINLEHSVAVVLHFWRLYRFIRSIVTLIYDFFGSYVASVASVSARVRRESWDKSKEGEWRRRGSVWTGLNQLCTWELVWFVLR